MMENMELVDFKQPENGQIYVTKIKWSNTKIQLVHLLQERFSPFGLLHFVNVDQTGKALSFLSHSNEIFLSFQIVVIGMLMSTFIQY